MNTTTTLHVIATQNIIALSQLGMFF
jgi:hypothetical protein